MTTANTGLSAIRDPRLLRVGLATFQPAAGMLALLCSTVTVGYLVTGDGDDPARWPYAVAFVVGAALIVVWGAARKRPIWLIVLAALSAAFAAGMIILVAFAGRAARFDPHLGFWDSTWLGAVSVILWVLITVAALIERRLVRPGAGERLRPWSVGLSVFLAIAVVAAFVGLLVPMSDWEFRVNSLTSGSTAAVAASPSRLDGTTRWRIDTDGGDAGTVITASGLAVPVAADPDHNAGVIMVDPVTGTIRWRYELRGTETAPELSLTDLGRAIVIDYDESDLSKQHVPHRVFTLDSETGRIRAFWPDDITDTDPPVRFHHVAQGTNSVSGMSAEGRKLWTFKPRLCADPRGAVSTPDVIVVTTRKCDNNTNRVADELRGFDARTGDQLWTQPWDNDGPPDQIVAGKDFEVELGQDGTLRRRDLRTGRIAWSARLPCSEPAGTSASANTLFVHSCSADSDQPDLLQAYDLSTGKQLWQRRMQGTRITALAAVNDQHVVTLTVDTVGKNPSCRADLIGRTSARTLQTFPQDNRGRDPLATFRPGLVQCDGSSLHQLAGSVVLQLHLSTNGGGLDQTRYRLVGLA